MLVALPKRALYGGRKQLDNAHMDFDRHAVDGGFALSSIAVDHAGSGGGFDQVFLQCWAMCKLRVFSDDRERCLDRVTAPIRDAGGQ